MRMKGELLLNSLFLIAFTAILYFVAFLQTKQLQTTKNNIAEAIAGNSLDNYSNSLPQNEMSALLHLLCDKVAETKQHTEAQKKENR